MLLNSHIFFPQPDADRVTQHQLIFPDIYCLSSMSHPEIKPTLLPPQYTPLEVSDGYDYMLTLDTNYCSNENIMRGQVVGVS